jgi:aspartate carbamoyltransferase catalytic subunit
MHIIKISQFFDDKLLTSVLNTAVFMEDYSKHKPVLKGKVLASLFYEPSTRTRFSFEAAMHRLGGSVIGTESAGHFSSVTKGETLRDTIRIVSGYADVIILRHPEKGSAEIAASVSSVPVINAGDGIGEHPTQALLDVYTIRKELGRTDNIKIAMIGDLLYGRTVHSLTYLLAQMNNVEFFFVSPQILKMPAEIIGYLKSKHIKFTELEDMKAVIPDVDILYVTRIQKERFNDLSQYEAVKNLFIVDRSIVSRMKETARVLHPLPRVNEISTEVDNDPRAAYFREARNGLFIRMALLKLVLS